MRGSREQLGLSFEGERLDNRRVFGRDHMEVIEDFLQKQFSEESVGARSQISASPERAHCEKGEAADTDTGDVQLCMGREMKQ